MIVLLKVPNPLHSALKVLVSNPPDGYSYLQEEHKLWEQSNGLYLAMSSLLQKHNWIRNASLLTKERLGSFMRPPKAPLIFSLAQYTGFNSVPTILYKNEVANSGAAEKTLSRSLLQKANITKVLVPNQTTAQTYFSFLSGEFASLIGVLRLGAIVPSPFKKERRGKITMLFVSSANRGNVNWGDVSFYIRGGLDVLSSFRILNAQYGDRVNLIMCSDIPERAKLQFADVLRLQNVHVRGVVPREVLDSIYSTSDILLYPGYRGVVTITEAFSYFLPVVASDSWDLPDYVADGYNGLLVHRESEGLRRGHLPTWDVNSIASKPVDRGFAGEFAEATSRLIEDESLRLRLGKGARQTVEYGPFSIQFMKDELARYFNEAVAS